MTSSAYRDTSDSDSRGLSDVQVNMFKGLSTALSFCFAKPINIRTALPNLLGENGGFLNIHSKETILVIL